MGSHPHPLNAGESRAPIELHCEVCHRFVALANSPFDVPEHVVHTTCDALRMLTEVIPKWPRDPVAGGEVGRLKRAFPDWDWDAAWGSGAVGTLPMSPDSD